MKKVAFIDWFPWVVWVSMLSLFVLGCRPDDAAPQTDPFPSRELLNSYDAEFKTLLSEVIQEMGREVLRYEEIDSGLLPKKITITGTHYDLGYLIGRLGQKKFGDLSVLRPPESEAINQQMIAMYEEIYPPYLDLLCGVAAARGVTTDELDLRYMEHLYFMATWWYLFNYQSFIDQTDFSCSLVAYHLPATDRQLVGRNFDNQSDRPHFLVRTEMEGSHAVLGNTCYMPYHWVADGMNDQGLFIGVSTNGAPAKYNQKETGYPDVPFVQVIHMVRIALEKCATVQEAIELFQSVRIYFPEEVNHLLLADATGDAAVLEFDPERQAHVFRREQPYLVLTNSAYLAGLDFVEENCWRYQTAVPLLGSGVSNLQDLKQVMEAIRIRSGESRTLWQSLYDLSGRKGVVYYRAEDFTAAHSYQFMP